MESNLSRASPRDLRRLPLANISLACAAGLFGVVFLCYAIGLVALAMGGSVHGHFFYAACAGSAIAAGWLARRQGAPLPTVVILVVLLLAVISGSLLLSSFFFDETWDGQAYHEESIIQLALGGNPLYDILGQDIVNVDRQANFFWFRHYPKASWIFAAEAYLLTGDIDSGKSYHLFLAAAAFFLSFSAAVRLRGLPFWGALLISVVAAANPLMISQMFSFYVDGALGSLTTSFVALSVMLYLRPNWYLGCFWVAVAILAINLKFTGIPYVVILGGGFVCLAVVVGKLDVARVAGVSLILGVCLGSVAFGFDPYVKNTIAHGNPFYPVRGEGAVDIMSSIMPEQLKHMGRFEKLTFSLLHESTNLQDASAHLKVPLSIPSKAEIDTFESPDVLLGGWGPLFGGIVLLALVAAVIGAVIPRSRRSLFFMTASVSLVFASVLINPEAWWARYTPQLWLVPLIICATLILRGGWISRSVGTVIGLLMVMNAGLVAKGYLLSSYWATSKTHEELHVLARDTDPISVYFGEFPGLRLRLLQAGVRFAEVQAVELLPCSDPHHFSKLAGVVTGKVWYCTNHGQDH